MLDSSCPFNPVDGNNRVVTQHRRGRAVVGSPRQETRQSMRGVSQEVSG